MRRTLCAVLGLAGLITLLTGCAVNPVTGRQQVMLLSESDEARMGSATDKDILETYGLYDEKGLQGYLQGICRKIGAVGHRPTLPYALKVLDSPVVNAFAVPGGYVYVTRGILAYIDSEAELAGILGHEIGHITARHSAQAYTRAQLANIGLGIGMLLSPSLQTFAREAQAGLSVLFLKFSRDDEREADALGVAYASKAGYAAVEVSNFFQTLHRLNPSSGRDGLPSWLSTHPDPEDRIGAIRRSADEWQRRLGPGALAVNRDAYLRTIDGMVFGEDPREGYAERGVFYHPLLGFQFPVPAQWHLENTRQAVRMSSPEKDGLLLFSLSGKGTPRALADAFVRNNRAAVYQASDIERNGLKGFRVLSRIQTQSGPVQVLSTFLSWDRSVAVFHGVAAPQAFEGYRPLFEDTQGRFMRISDRARLNPSPTRIAIRQATKTATLDQTLRGMDIPSDAWEGLAILNGMELKDRVKEGTLLKILVK